MNFSKLLQLAIAAAFIAGIAPGDALAKKDKPKKQIKFATVAPEGTTWMNVMHEFDDELRVATDNRVGFKFYPGGVQGDEKDVLRKMRNGQIQAGGFTGFGLGAIASEFRAIEVPFMYRDLDEVDYTRVQMDQYYRDLYKEKGFLFLGWADVGFVYIFSNATIQSPQDLQRAKVWTWSGDKLAELFFAAFDVSPIPLALPDVLTSLQMGVINTVYAPPLAAIALQWFSRVDYMTDVPVTYGFGAFLMTEKGTKGISDDDMLIMRELATKYSTALNAKTRVENLEAIELMQQEGVQVLTVDATVADEFFARGRGAWQDGVGKLYPAELLERVSKTVDEYRSQSGASK